MVTDRTAYAAAYRAANRGKIRAAHLKRQRARRLRIARIKLELACVDCGWSPSTIAETTRLHFDHIDPATKHNSRNGGAYLPSWSWARILRELALCETRCRSCHGRRSALQGQQRRRTTATTHTKEND